MRNLSLFVAFAFVLTVPSLAGSSQTDLPGIGTFSYSGSPMVPPAPALMVAGLTRADRS